MNKFDFVIKRSGAKVPFKKERVMNAIYRAAVSVGGRDKERAEFLAGKVIEYLENIFDEGYTPHIEEIQDAVEKALVENGHAKVAKEYIIYRNEQHKKREEASKYASKPSENIPWSKIWHVLNWAVDHNLNTVEKLNSRIEKGEFPHIVHESENAYEQEILTAADLIKERISKLKMVFVTGPSSSGKTTTTIKLEKKLKQEGYSFVALNVDNYFFDLELHPKDEFGDYDFETPQALDLELIDRHLQQLAEGEEIKIPFYDFKTGSRKLDVTPFKLKENQILLIDSLHGLYPKMSRNISEELKFKLYLEPLLQMRDKNGKYIRWTDIRLIRRMLRDSVHRAYNPKQTLEHWHYVRGSEMRNIMPYANTADYIINSSMSYELPLYAHRMLALFREWEKEFEGNPLREDAYTRASRLRSILESIIPVDDDTPVPADSVLREFIGGSIFEY